MLSVDLNARALGSVIVGGDFNARPADPRITRFYSHRVGGKGRSVELDETHHGPASRSGEATFDLANRKINYVFAPTAHFRAPHALSYATGMSDRHLNIGTIHVVRRRPTPPTALASMVAAAHRIRCQPAQQGPPGKGWPYSTMTRIGSEGYQELEEVIS